MGAGQRGIGAARRRIAFVEHDGAANISHGEKWMQLVCSLDLSAAAAVAVITGAAAIAHTGTVLSPQKKDRPFNSII